MPNDTATPPNQDTKMRKAARPSSAADVQACVEEPELKTPPKQEGAAMLLVLMILLMSTATATFAIQSTTTEMRSAGHSRQALQTQYIAETGVGASTAKIDEYSPSAFVRVLQSAPAPDVSAYEPPLVNTQGYRVMLQDFPSTDPNVDNLNPGDPLPDGAAVQVGADGSLGPVVHQPDFVVDMNDVRNVPCLTPGQRAGGGNSLSCMKMTLTSRAETQVPGNVDAMNGASNARAWIMVGPIGN